MDQYSKTKHLKFRTKFSGVLPSDDAVDILTHVEVWLQNHEKELLSKYNEFLLKEGYCDTDIEQEEPTAIDQFLMS